MFAYYTTSAIVKGHCLLTTFAAFSKSSIAKLLSHAICLKPSGVLQNKLITPQQNKLMILLVFHEVGYLCLISVFG